MSIADTPPGSVEADVLHAADMRELGCAAVDRSTL
jgi:hypothetical protein